MKKTRFTKDQMVTILQQADQQAVPAVAKKHGVGARTIDAWRKHVGTLEPADVTRQPHQVHENGRLKNRRGTAGRGKQGAKVASIAKKPARPKGAKKSTKQSARPELVHRFLIVLTGTDPVIWRRIEVPERYSFWDLHVAIQDAMGWLDYHVHEFRLLAAGERKVVSIGIPAGEESADRPVLPGWQLPVGSCLGERAANRSARCSPIMSYAHVLRKKRSARDQHLRA